MSNTLSKAHLVVGDVIAEGANKGWIYCASNDAPPFLLAPADCPDLVIWADAAHFAEVQQATLPSLAQLRAIYELKHNGKLARHFEAASINNGRKYWTAERDDGFFSFAALMDMDDGSEHYQSLLFRHSVRCVRPYTPA